MKMPIPFRLNGKPTTLDTDADRTLLWALRGDLGLTGTKYGCGEGVCGACTVIVGDRAVRSCQTAVKEVAGKDVTTIEGLAAGGRLHPLQEAFVAHGGFQCGYCTSGMIMSAAAFLRRVPGPSRSQIVEEMEGNLCRCGAHRRIVAAIEDAARRSGGRS